MLVLFCVQSADVLFVYLRFSCASSGAKDEWTKRKYNGKMKAEKLEIRSQQEGEEENWNIPSLWNFAVTSIEKLDLEAAEIVKKMRIHKIKQQWLWWWIVQIVLPYFSKQYPVEVPIIIEKVNQTALKMGMKFQWSNNWLQWFKQKCSITWWIISGQGSGVDVLQCTTKQNTGHGGKKFKDRMTLLQ
jgi:hypothetical protein